MEAAGVFVFVLFFGSMFLLLIHKKRKTLSFGSPLLP
jgi:hypothetical protein